jgi:hypothetical protein
LHHATLARHPRAEARSCRWSVTEPKRRRPQLTCDWCWLPAAHQVRNFYIELMKRMDDSNDRIRIECAAAFEKFMASVPRNYDSAQYDYIVRGLVVHLDDQNQEVPCPLALHYLPSAEFCSA